MEAWQKRVIDEQHELEFKVNKLNNFIHSKEFEKIPFVDRYYLIQQEIAMTLYLAILIKRIDSF